ncbi:MAG: hypothetical protein FWF71_07395 [Actinomycetia bacterium]|nr:hypothetical protein [Actinomycetes bacterium]
MFIDDSQQKYYSAASLWEIVIKTMTGKLPLKIPVEKFEEAMAVHGLRRLDITVAHIYGIQNLERI